MDKKDSMTSVAAGFQAIYDGTNYDHLRPWDTERESNGAYIPLRSRKPRIRYRLGTSICNRVAGFLLSPDTFPDFGVGGEMEDGRREGLNKALKWLRNNGGVMKKAAAACVNCCVQGSGAITFGFVRGKLVVRVWRRTQAMPLFDDAGELLGLVVRYSGVDKKDGKVRWWRWTVDAVKEVWESAEKMDGPWEKVEEREHGFGFVPGVWVTHLGGDEIGGVEGVSMLNGIEDHLVDLDYTFSQRSRSLQYTADPQTVIKDQDPESTAKALIKAPSGTWLVGPEGAVEYLEISGEGIALQGVHGDALRRAALEVARVVLPDPDRVSGGNLSGFALRIMYEAMIDLCDLLKQDWGPALTGLMQKIIGAAVVVGRRGQAVRVPGIAEAVRGLDPIVARGEVVRAKHPWFAEARDWPEPGFAGDLVDLTATWGPYFDTSPDEEKAMVDSTGAAVSVGLLSRESGVRHCSPYFGVADADGELALLEAESAVGGGKEVFGYHLEAGVVNVNEARRGLGLAPTPGGEATVPELKAELDRQSGS